MISTKSGGSFKHLEGWAAQMQKEETIVAVLNKYGQAGVDALSHATPRDTGLAATSWGYRLIKNKHRYRIEWFNDNIENGVQVVILIQYGHATKSGTIVHGLDFINPAIRPIFDSIEAELWEKVTK